MSGTASVPNSFAAAVTATGAQLDANYSTIVAYVNDPTNRNNYAAGGAATNTVALTFAPPVVGGYTAGLELTWKWGVTNTGAVVANANGLGDINVVNPNGAALVAGQGTAGSVGKGVYDGTRAIFLTPPSPASAAEVSAAVTLSPYVSPGRMQSHSGVAKAWAAFIGTSTGTITANASYGVSQIVRAGTGTYAITFTQPFATPSAYAIATGTNGGVAVLSTKAAASCIVHIFTTGGVAADVTDVNVVIFGFQ